MAHGRRLEKSVSKASLPMSRILPIKIANILKTKLESVSLSCESHRSKAANIEMLIANSKHRS